jgi:formate hydrogenlyase subunit 4
LRYATFINVFLGLVLAPLVLGIINRTKAVFAGRKGQPVLQTYFDLFRLFHKSAVYSRTTTVVFRLGPMVGLAACMTALFLVPFSGENAPFAFAGDFLLFIGLLGLARFLTVLAALDTGSSFEGMGASREVWLSALAEPALLLGFAVVVRKTGALSLSDMFHGVSIMHPEIILTAVAFGIVLLCENARLPFDDPNTHLELTMIHEVMVLDHGGPDLGFILYGSSIKLWLYGNLLMGLLLPKTTPSVILNILEGLAGMFLIAVLVGIIESVMARLRLARIPQLLAAAGALSALAFILSLG